MKTLLVAALVAWGALWPAGSGWAADASYFGVVKSAQFQQTVSSPPTILSSNAYAFTAFVVPATNYAVTNASFAAPNVITNRSLTLSTNGDLLMYSETFQTSGALEAGYPSSTGLISPSVYRFTLDTLHDGVRNGKASYILGGNPPTPEVTNLPEVQSIDTTTDLTLRWPAMGGLLGVVQLLVLDPGSNVVYSSPAPFTTDALSPASTSGKIPANSLPAGANLIAHLVFARAGLPDTNSYSGAIGVATIARDTAFPLITRPAPIRPWLQLVTPGSVPVEVQFSGETNRNYHLQATTNLVSAEWMDLLVTNAGAVSFTDTQSVTLPQRYYRVRVGP
jgi:hypothetical protein